MGTVGSWVAGGTVGGVVGVVGGWVVGGAVGGAVGGSVAGGAVGGAVGGSVVGGAVGGAVGGSVVGGAVGGAVGGWVVGGTVVWVVGSVPSVLSAVVPGSESTAVWPVVSGGVGPTQPAICSTISTAKRINVNLSFADISGLPSSQTILESVFSITNTKEYVKFPFSIAICRVILL